MGNGRRRGGHHENKQEYMTEEKLKEADTDDLINEVISRLSVMTHYQKGLITHAIGYVHDGEDGETVIRVSGDTMVAVAKAELIEVNFDRKTLEEFEAFFNS